MTGSVTEQLVAFARRQFEAGPPAEALHEATRLLINQLKASVGASRSDAVCILHDWAVEAGHGREAASILWFGTSAGPEQACMVNAALFEVLDFNETYIPTFQHAVSGVLPAVIAEAEASGSRGADVIAALAIGIEVELACAAILMPTGYFRGFVPGGVTGAIGGAVACALLTGQDETQMRDALGLAMNSGLGTYQAAGSMALPLIMANAARNGLVAARLAGRGLGAPAAAFEGDKGMLSAYSDEPAEKIEAVLATLGQTWRILGQSYKTVPTETITHGPIECVLALRERAAGRTPGRMRFDVAPIVVTIANERAERFGAPTNDLEAKFDLRHCTAAAWLRGRFTLAEMSPAAFTDPAVLDLRSRTDLVADPAQETFNGAGLTIDYTDGSSDHIFIPAFRGTPGNPMSDEELSAVFRRSAEGLLSPARMDALLAAAWGLKDAADIRTLLRLAILDLPQDA